MFNFSPKGISKSSPRVSSIGDTIDKNQLEPKATQKQWQNETYDLGTGLKEPNDITTFFKFDHETQEILSTPLPFLDELLSKHNTKIPMEPESRLINQPCNIDQGESKEHASLDMNYEVKFWNKINQNHTNFPLTQKDQEIDELFFKGNNGASKGLSLFEEALTPTKDKDTTSPEMSVLRKWSLQTKWLKSGKETDNKIPDLKLRKDVVNKNFIRAIKRHYDNIWAGNKRVKSIKNEKATTHVWDNIDRICEIRFSKYFESSTIFGAVKTYDLLIRKPSNTKDAKDVTYEDMKYLIASIVMPDVWKMAYKSHMRQSIMTAFSNVAYKYSHKKLKIMLKMPIFKLFIKQFVESEDFEYMLNNDATLKRSPDIYREKGFEFAS